MNQKNLGAILDAATAMVGDVESISGLLEENARLRAQIDPTPFRAIVARIIAEANLHPFNPIGHIVEQVIPEIREALTDAQQPAEHTSPDGVPMSASAIGLSRDFPALAHPFDVLAMQRKYEQEK